MSDRNDSPDMPGRDPLLDEFRDLQIPLPDAQVRRAAIAVAMEAFDEEQDRKASVFRRIFQGLPSRLRPSAWESAEEREPGMFAFPRVMMGGLGAACVAVLAVGLVLRSPGLQPGAETGSLDPYGDAYSVEMGRRSVEAVRERRINEPGTAQVAAPEQQAEAAADYDYYGSIPPQPAAPEARAATRADHALAKSLEEVVVTGVDPRAVGIVSDDARAAVPGYEEVGRDRFEAFDDNPVRRVTEAPVSTFSIDVDTASYSFVRRQLNRGLLPQPDAVRAEELINYFDYRYPAPVDTAEPFATTVAVSDAPWAPGRKLLHIGIKGYEVPAARQPRSNLVFLLDVSGSMKSPDKLPLVKQSMELLLSSLRPDDTVSIAVYAGAAGTVLEPTPVRERRKILAAMDRLRAGGSTAGAQGIRLAYELAESSFDEAAVNRVILATDGDFNVGITSDRELQGFIERQRDAGIYLSVLGFGQGNYQDQRMQTLAQNGNGIAAYIDTLSEAQKVLVTEATSSLIPIASDVKIQVEFNPATVSEYRLIGYETRGLNREDFNNDRVDAGDIGAGHSVTAIYEITPADSAAQQIDPLRYADVPAATGAATPGSDEYAFLRLRYKLPGESFSQLIERPITPDVDGAEALTPLLRREFNFATAVAGFAQLLRGGRFSGDYGYDEVIALAQASKGRDEYGYRTEFIQLVRKAALGDRLRPRRSE